MSSDITYLLFDYSVVLHDSVIYYVRDVPVSIYITLTLGRIRRNKKRSNVPFLAYYSWKESIMYRGVPKFCHLLLSIFFIFNYGVMMYSSFITSSMEFMFYLPVILKKLQFFKHCFKKKFKILSNFCLLKLRGCSTILIFY